MVETYLLHHNWIPALAWIILYTGDYYLTLYGARLREMQSVYNLEGSYELTPEYEKDVDSRRKLSPTFIAWLVYGVIIMFVPTITGCYEGMDRIYGFLVGALIVLELAVLYRHFQNTYMYKTLSRPDSGVTGSISLSRSYIYKSSAVQLAIMAALMLILAALTMSAILLGGAIAITGISWQHNRLSAKQKSSKETVTIND